MAAPSPERRRQFKKGETLFRSGEKTDRVYLLQSGLVSLLNEKADQKIEITQASAPQLIGEDALWGSATRVTSAVAINATEAIELTLPQAQALIASFALPLKLTANGLLTKQKVQFDEVVLKKSRAAHPELITTPDIARLFATLFHAASSTSKPNPKNELTVVWSAFRKYCYWGLLESPARVERAVQLLAKLGYARLEMVKSTTDPDAPDELGFVHFNDLGLLKKFYLYADQNRALELPVLMVATQLSQDPEHRKFVQFIKGIQSWNGPHGNTDSAQR